MIQQNFELTITTIKADLDSYTELISRIPASSCAYRMRQTKWLIRINTFVFWMLCITFPHLKYIISYDSARKLLCKYEGNSPYILFFSGISTFIFYISFLHCTSRYVKIYLKIYPSSINILVIYISKKYFFAGNAFLSKFV